MSIESLQSELKKVEQRKTKLEQQIKKQQQATYTSLPRKVGLKSVDALVKALLPFASPNFRQKFNAGLTPSQGGEPAKATRAAASAAGKGGHTRYDAAMKSKVRADMAAGKRTRDIHEETGVGIETLKKWKRGFGLTRGTRSKVAVTSKVRVPKARSK